VAEKFKVTGTTEAVFSIRLKKGLTRRGRVRASGS
jgi:hypothetical protein